MVEVMPYSGGLPRNMKQCIEDFDIPGILTIPPYPRSRGKERVSSVMVSRVDENRKPIPGMEFEIECDTLMISAGLIPENELTEQAGIEISKGTHGAVVTEDLQTSAKGFFACGNVLHVHDLVDFVATEAEEAGVHAAKYIQADTGDAGETIIVENGDGAGAVCPQMIHRMPKQDKVALMFRPRNKFRDVTVSAESDGKVIAEKLIAVTPGEMIRLEIPADKLAQAGGCDHGFAERRCALMADKNTELICINCPRGCLLQVEQQGEEIAVTGNFCSKGIPYAKQEITDPAESTDDPYAPGGSRQASQREDGQAGAKSSAERMCESSLQYSSEASGEVR